MIHAQAGHTLTLKVVNETPPYGYFLSIGERNVLLHYSEATRPLSAGDEVEVFLFHDTEDRLSATMKSPLIRWDEIKRLEVVDFHPNLGCFLDFGLGRNLLLPLSELPEDERFHPQVGDQVYVLLERDRSGRLIARKAGEDEMLSLSGEAPMSWKNLTIQGYVYHTLKQGTFMLCDGGVLGYGIIGFIHASERTRLLRVGERVEARVAFVREDGRVNLSMRPLKEISQLEDAEKVLNYLHGRGGRMPYSDATQPDIIREIFNISKAAFKRALGKLMKDGQIEQRDGWTYLKSVAQEDEG